MSAPRHREFSADAPVPVARSKRSWLRRHWLTGALFFGLAVFATRTGSQLYLTEDKLQEAVRTRAEIEAKVSEARLRKENLERQQAERNTDAYKELMAKKLGYVYPNETVYQNGN